MAVGTNEKLDLVKLRPDAFKAGTEPALVTLEPAFYLTLDGKGDPSEPGGDFQHAIGALYGVAYALKMRYKALGMDYKMPPLEATWRAYQSFADRPCDPSNLDERCWRWKAMIMLPDYVRREDIEAVKAQQFEKKHLPPIQRIELTLVDEGLCVQLMHIGPYAEEARAVNAMRRFMDQAGLRSAGLHHEVYFNDPHRTAPEKIRTLLRQPVRRIEEDFEGYVAEEW